MATEDLTGTVWDTGAGNHWRVEEMLSGERVRVRCVHQTLPRGRDLDPRDYTFIWHVSSLTGGKRLN